MSPFDDIARLACKVGGAGFLAWALARLTPVPPLLFDRWDDARRVSPPGWPDRTDDLVAVLAPADAGPPVWLIVESETDPERFIFHRLGIYALLLSVELSRGASRGGEPEVGVLLLNLTGQPRGPDLRLGVRDTGRGLTVAPLVINFRTVDAAATLDEIAAGATAPALLPWVPLMAGGGRPELIARWRALAEAREPDAATRALYRDIALVFAELSRELLNWQQGLEGWEMQQSTVIQGWIDRGMQRGAVEKARAVLLRFIRTQLQDPVPEPVRLAVEGTNDPDVLDRWLDAAFNAGSMQDLTAAMKAP